MLRLLGDATQFDLWAEKYSTCPKKGIPRLKCGSTFTNESLVIVIVISLDPLPVISTSEKEEEKSSFLEGWSSWTSYTTSLSTYTLAKEINKCPLFYPHTHVVHKPVPSSRILASTSSSILYPSLFIWKTLVFTCWEKQPWLFS